MARTVLWVVERYSNGAQSLPPKRLQSKENQGQTYEQKLWLHNNGLMGVGGRDLEARLLLGKQFPGGESFRQLWKRLIVMICMSKSWKAFYLGDKYLPWFREGKCLMCGRPWGDRLPNSKKVIMEKDWFWGCHNR